MKRMAAPLACLLACAVLALGVAGCGPKKVKVHGKLMHGKKPLRGNAREPIQVVFTAYDEKKPRRGAIYLATVDDKAGTYEVMVPVGRYRISVLHFTRDLSDRFDNAFGEGVSPIIRDVTGEGELDIDLSKPISGA